MKPYSLLFFLLLPGVAWAQVAAPIRVPAPVREVTLFASGAAELRHEARPTLPSGTVVVRVVGLAASLDAASLQATVAAGAELLSTELAPSDRPLALDSAARLRLASARAQAAVVALEEEKNLLIANREVRGTTPATWSADVGRVAAAFRERMTDVVLRLNAAGLERDRLRYVVERLPPNQGDGRAAGQDVLLRLRVRAAGPVELGVSYRVADGRSGWTTELALRTGRLTEPLRAESTARVTNGTGAAWTGVRLTLVNAPASQRVRRPNLQPWVAKLTNSDDDDRRDDDESAGEGRLDDFAVKGTSAASAGGATDSLSASPAGAAFSDRFRVPGRPSVPPGIPTRVEIETLSLPLRAEYYVVPKLDADVLLVGKVTGLQKLRAPASSAAVYLAGNYVGTTELNTRAFNDSVEVALGVDPQVVVSRTKRADKTSRRLLGGKQRVALGYEINLRNGRTSPIRVRVADQVPVPLDKEITINVTETSGATLDAESGRLTWLVDLKPGESRNLAFAFTVEAPEGKGLNLDRRVRTTRSPKFR